jgi:hypothetical protein
VKGLSAHGDAAREQLDGSGTTTKKGRRRLNSKSTSNDSTSLDRETLARYAEPLFLNKCSFK